MKIVIVLINERGVFLPSTSLWLLYKDYITLSLYTQTSSLTIWKRAIVETASIQSGVHHPLFTTNKEETFSQDFREILNLNPLRHVMYVNKLLMKYYQKRETFFKIFPRNSAASDLKFLACVSIPSTILMVPWNWHVPICFTFSVKTMSLN